MTEAIEVHVIEIHTIHVQLGLRNFVYRINAVSCFKHQFDTLLVQVQGVLFLIEFRNLTISPISKSTLLA